MSQTLILCPAWRRHPLPRHVWSRPLRVRSAGSFIEVYGSDLNCRYDVNRIHTVFSTREGGVVEKTDDVKLEYSEQNTYTHLYTLIVYPNQTYQILFDTKEKTSGRLHDHWGFPSETMDDPSDVKPEDWDDRKMIPDPDDVMPEEFKAPEIIPDPEASRPEDWDEEMDGEWEAPVVLNPAYKGVWEPMMIPNPDYQGSSLHIYREWSRTYGLV